jgi:hypothetical protein
MALTVEAVLRWCAVPSSCAELAKLHGVKEAPLRSLLETLQERDEVLFKRGDKRYQTNEAGLLLLKQMSESAERQSKEPDGKAWNARIHEFLLSLRPTWNELRDKSDEGGHNAFTARHCRDQEQGWWSTQIRLDNGDTSNMSNSTQVGARICDVLDRAIHYEANGELSKISVTANHMHLRLRPKRSGPYEELWYASAPASELFWVTQQIMGPFCMTLLAEPDVKVLQYYLLGFQRDYLTRFQHEQIMQLSSKDSTAYKTFLEIARNLDVIIEIRSGSQMREHLAFLQQESMLSQ